MVDSTTPRHIYSTVALIVIIYGNIDLWGSSCKWLLEPMSSCNMNWVLQKGTGVMSFIRPKSAVVDHSSGNLVLPISRLHLSSTIFVCPGLSSHILTCPPLSMPVLACPRISLRVLPCHRLSWPVLAYPYVSSSIFACPPLSWPVLPSLACPRLSWPVFACPGLSTPLLTWTILSSLAYKCRNVLLQWIIKEQMYGTLIYWTVTTIIIKGHDRIMYVCVVYAQPNICTCVTSATRHHSLSYSLTHSLTAPWFNNSEMSLAELWTVTWASEPSAVPCPIIKRQEFYLKSLPKHRSGSQVADPGRLGSESAAKLCRICQLGD